MPAAYSDDLRKKAMEALDEGQSREEVAERFKIGKTTLFEWQQRRKETGDFRSKKLGIGAITIKSLTGMHLLDSLKNMEERLC